MHYLFGDEDETSPLAERDEGPAPVSAVSALARYAVEKALTRFQRRSLDRPDVAVVVEVPDETWVDPVAEYLNGRCEWSATFARTGSSKFEDAPGKGNAQVRLALAGGGRVLGVSQDARRYLPSALLTSADLFIDISAPSSGTIAQLISAACGRHRLRIPEGLGNTLSFDEIVSQIRAGSKPSVCVARLRSAAASKSISDPSVATAPLFEELEGYGEAKTWGLDLIASVREWRAGGPLPGGRNIILSSDPGMGKTSMARSLARSANMCLVSTSVSDWFRGSSYLDGFIKAANAAIDEALAKSPSILAIDELDGLASRTGLDADRASWWTPAITSVLLGIDRIVASKKHYVVIIGATNHADRLDPALVRPGRLDRIIELRKPDAPALAAIIRQHLGADLPGVDLRGVAELGLGATGAVAAGWVANARAVARREARAMRLTDLVSVIAPPETRPPEVMWRAAVHESGHAVAIHFQRLGRIRSISLIPSSSEAGRVVHEPVAGRIATREGIEATVVALLAARAAEIRICGSASSGAGGGSGSDLGRATELVAAMHGSLGLRGNLVYRGEPGELLEAVRLDTALRQTVEKDLQRLAVLAESLVEDRESHIRKLALALVERRSLTGVDVLGILGSG